MTHGSLFSGIGGFDLAAEWMGWENIFHCEWDPFGQQVLKHHFPNSISYHDITKTDFTIHRGQIDILTGGFPCQPYSLAGKRKGKEDERHLWPEMLRTIREIQPRYVVGENVSGIINWNGGMVFDEVQSEMEAEGYEVIPFVLPACAVNAPHRRDRVWFIAHRKSDRDRGGLRPMEEKDGRERESEECRKNHNEFRNDGKERTTSHSNSNGQQRSDSKHEKHTSEGGEYALGDIKQMGKYDDTTYANEIGFCRQEQVGQMEWERFGFDSKRELGDYWQNFPTQSPICTGNDGIPTQLDGITFPKWRAESIKAAGNAIVPQVALQIFKAIIQTQC